MGGRPHDGLGLGPAGGPVREHKFKLWRRAAGGRARRPRGPPRQELGHARPAGPAPCYDETRAATFIEAECTYDDVQYYCPWLATDVADAPRYEADVPKSTHFNWLARAPDVCIKDADSAQFDVTCENAFVLDELTLTTDHMEDCSALRGS